MGTDTYNPRDPTHPGPNLATADRLRELVRRIGPHWEVLGLLNAILYDWEPRLAALVPPVPATRLAEKVAAPPSHRLVFGEEPFEIHRKAKGKRR